MKREWTNKIRFVLDELVPPIMRDSKWFMWPFFVMAYGTFSVSKYMSFKSCAYSMTDEEYAKFYGSLGNSVSRRRITDLNSASIKKIIESALMSDGMSILDVGAGNGYLLEKLKLIKNWNIIAGVDVAPAKDVQQKFTVYANALPTLQFYDKQFDIVTCTHVIEHVLDPAASIKELLRVAAKLLIVVIPRQRYFYYTLDEHLNFYPDIEPFLYIFSPYKVTVSLQGGDWFLLVDLERQDIS